MLRARAAGTLLLVSGGQWADAIAIKRGSVADPATIQRESGFADEPPPRFMGRLEEQPRPPQPDPPHPKPESRQLSVLVGSDDPFTRQAFRTGASGPGISVVGAGTLATVANQMAPELEPDIVLLDVQTTAANALRAIQDIRLRAPEARILACSAPANNEFGLLCLSAGALGYVSKEIDLDVLPRLLRALADGEAVIPRALGTELALRFVRSNASGHFPPPPLSPPERRLLDLLRTGQSLAEAALELGITLATARRHFGSARRKLATRRLTEVTTDDPSSSQRTNSPEVS